MSGYIKLSTEEKYDKCTYYTKVLTIGTAGRLNGYFFSPSVIGENMAFPSTSVGQIASTGTPQKLIQVFRQGTDNIQKITLVASRVVNDFYGIEDFESYADTTALRAAWVPSDSTNFPNSLDTTIYYQGTKAMRFNANNSQAVADEVVRDYGVSGTNWSGYTTISFWWRQNTAVNKFLIKLVLEDTSGNRSSVALNVGALETWELHEIEFINFTPETASAPDMSALRYVKFVVVESRQQGAIAYVDFVGLSGTGATEGYYLKAELYDCGTTQPTASASVADWTLLTSDTGDTEHRFYGLTGIQSLLHMEHEFGSFVDRANVLTPGNYYALVLTASNGGEYIIYGASDASSHPYPPGKLFKSTDGGTTLVDQGFKDICFGVYTTPDVELREIKITPDAADGTSSVFMQVHANTHIIENEIGSVSEIELKADGSAIMTCETDIHIGNTDNMAVFVDHDVASPLRSLALKMKVLYNNFTVYGGV